ncbi:sugar transferase [Pseudidiomarina salilacus]|uniref:sugar transferase n=1 Tax=Pseudidiomarina salilacus TaxID=3384452 RepID=UPI003985031D
MKRLFDVVSAIIGIVLLSPVFLAVAIWIKFDSPGPIFFRQVRVGRNGETFRIHKFRSMSVDAESKGKLTVGRRDSRVTRSGNFIRKFKIDELPQLFDVFIGNMSLVGPRPEVPEYIACYEPAIREKVLSVRPGITDNASIMMVDENAILEKYDDPHAAYIEQILPIKQKLYVDYVDNHSFVGDLVIIFKTVFKVITR